MVRSIICAGALSVAACSPQHEKTSWQSRPSPTSLFRATLTEDAYNYGESNEFSLRIDASPSKSDNGWFFVGPLETGGRIHSPKPQLSWTSPADLLVTVHTGELTGQTIRRFGGNGRPSGSVTFQYIADGEYAY